MAEFLPTGGLAGQILGKEMDLDPDQVSSRNEFDLLSITEILDQDPRPTFIIDLDPDDSITIGAKRVSPIFCNSALRLHERLFDVVIGNDTEPLISAYEEFSTWATGVTRFDDSKDVFPNTCLFFDLIWTGFTIRKRWRLISGNLWSGGVQPRDPSRVSDDVPYAEQPIGKESQEAFPTRRFLQSSTEASGNTGTTTLVSSGEINVSQTVGASSDDNTSSSSQSHRIILAAPEKAVADWTVPNPKGMLSPHIAFARTVRWENTPLGPMSKWSREFRQIVNLVMSNPRKCRTPLLRSVLNPSSWPPVMLA